WRDCAGAGTDASVVVTLPSGGDCCHKGGRLAFGPDGKLYVTLGDEHAASAAQNTADARGKVLRYNPDGSIPADNPFGATNPVWGSESSTVVPTGAAFVDASGPARFAGHLVVCTYDRGMLILSAGSPHAAAAGGPSGCRLAVEQGPDHTLYFSDDSTIHRMA